MILSSCSKDFDSELPTGKSEIPAYVITSEKTVDIDEFIGLLRNPLVSVISSSFFDDEVSATVDMLQPKIQMFKQNGIRIKRVNFSYRSTDRLGNPLTLSVHLCYPVAKSNVFEISSITLYSHIMTLDESFIPTEFFNIDELRAFHGAAVVIPDLQGSGLSYNSYANYAAPLTDARQSIEALLLAKDIIARDSRAGLADDFHTDNIGVSRGGMAALAIQKYIEDCNNDSIADAVNLKGTFFAELNPSFWGRFEAMGSVGTFLNRTAWYQTLPSAYYFYPEYMEGLDYSDFFTEEFNSRMVRVGGRRISMADALRQQKWNLLEQYNAWSSNDGRASDILNHEFCNSDGTLNRESRQWKALAQVAETFDYESQWHLEHPMTVGMHEADYMAPFSEIQEFVEDLQSRTSQPVRLLKCDFTSPIDDKAIIHALAAIYWEFYSASHETLF